MDRQLLAGEDLFAIEIGNWHFRRRNQPQVIIGTFEAIFGKFGELPSGSHRCRIDEDRRANFSVACGNLSIEHEANQGAFERRTRTNEGDKAALSEFGAALKI